MKTFFLICVAVLLTNCTIRSSADGIGDSETTATPISSNANSNNANDALHNRVIDAATLVAKDRLAELDKQNEKYKIVPDEFKAIDFRNFTYQANGSSIKLKNGERDFFEDKNWGNGWLTFNHSFFIDLISDENKEAVVFLGEGHCGVSCDGGAFDIYFYALNKSSPNLINTIETGSRSSGCSLKSFIIKDKQILLQQFGRCLKHSKIDENSLYSCKFCVKGETHSIYTFKNSKLVKKSSEYFETPEFDVMNYEPEISIND